MNIQELQTQIKNNDFKSIYIFTGAEIGVMDVYIKKLTAGKAVKRLDSIFDVYSLLQNQSILNNPVCYIIRDDKKFIENEKVQAAVKNQLGKDMAIFIFTTLDKRTKFYKRFDSEIIEFEKLAPEMLAKYIKKEIGLDEEYGIELAEMCNCDYSTIMLECDKLRQLKNFGLSDDFGSKYNIIGVYGQSKKEKLIHNYAKTDIFEFIDAVCRKQINKSLKLWKSLKEMGEVAMSILSLLYNNFRALLLVQSSKSSKGICEETGLTPFQVKLAKEKGQKYSIGSLVEALKKIRHCEKGIKTGLIDEEIAIDYLLVNILGC